LKSGAHIGTKYKTGEMRKYVFKRRKDGLRVLDVQTLYKRIRLSAKMLSRYPKERIAVVSRKLYGQLPVKRFAEAVGAKAFLGRFVPGTFTNPEGKEFFEPKIVLVTDPDVDHQAVSEAARLKIPVIALCSTNNSTKNVDLVIPVNNNGRKSLALVYWLLAVQLLKELKEIKKDSEFNKKVEDFEYQIKDEEEEEKERVLLKTPRKRKKK
jgi:small subunit ribosomal protein S2